MENNKSKLNIGFFFLSLGTLITLITSVVAFLNLTFETLNKKFPDVLNAYYQYGYSSYEYESIRTSLAILFIFFPAYLIISYFWKRYTKGEMGSIDVIIRKWMIFIILFLSMAVFMGDLVALIRYFLSGEITARFVWKVLVTLVTAIIVGKYYVFDLLDNKIFGWQIKKVGLMFSLTSIVLVLTAIVWSFTIMGSPLTQRAYRLDDRRINDLQSIQYQVINYYQQKEKMPSTLSDLANPITSYSIPMEPEFEKGKVYEYKVTGERSFELCAEFSLPTPKGWNENRYDQGEPYYENIKSDTVGSYPSYKGGVNESWNHEAGRTCFERQIDTDIYPPFSKMKLK